MDSIGNAPAHVTINRRRHQPVLRYTLIAVLVSLGVGMLGVVAAAAYAVVTWQSEPAAALLAALAGAAVSAVLARATAVTAEALIEMTTSWYSLHGTILIGRFGVRPAVTRVDLSTATITVEQIRARHDQVQVAFAITAPGARIVLEPDLYDNAAVIYPALRAVPGLRPAVIAALSAATNPARECTEPQLDNAQ